MSERNLIDINELALDKEWLGHARLYHEYAEKLAEARMDAEEARAHMELVEAELSLSLRRDYAQLGFIKAPTDKTVDAWVVAQKDFQIARKKYFDERRKAARLDAVVSALEHRKKALENMVTLWLHNYYSDPRAPTGAKEMITEMERQEIFGRNKRKVK